MKEEIREIGFAELHLIQHIVYETWPETYGTILSEIQLKYMLQKFYTPEALEKSMQEDQTFFVFFSEDKAVGFTSVQKYADSNSLKLCKLYVLPEVQGKGVGHKLFTKVEEICAKNKVRKLFLNVNRYNNAKQFYERMGMIVSHEEDIPIGNGYLMEDYVMVKEF